MSRRTLLTGATALGCALAIAGGGIAASASTGTSSSGIGRLPSSGKLTAVSGQSSLKHGLSASQRVIAPTSVKSWARTVKDGGTNFTYRMVGKSPFKVQTKPSTTIPTKLVPLIIKFSNGDTWNPTVGDNCDPASTSALTRTVNSPIFTSRSYSFGGTPVGTGQYVDAFQRANYYTYTNPAGINPGYHVKLGLSVLAPVTINVPNADAAEGTLSCGNGKLGAVEVNWLDSYLSNTVIPSLSAQGVGVKTFPMFLVGNVVEYAGSTANCCILGFHNAVSTAQGVQTYGISMYDNTGVFGPAAGANTDIATLSHEVGEWMDDPFVNNATKNWSGGQVTSGCQGNLEVGDPLSGTTFTINVSGYNYHPQEMAFTSWFYHQSPSTGVNGWYSNGGAFTSSAAPCP